MLTPAERNFIDTTNHMNATKCKLIKLQVAISPTSDEPLPIDEQQALLNHITTQSTTLLAKANTFTENNQALSTDSKELYRAVLFTVSCFSLQRSLHDTLRYLGKTAETKETATTIVDLSTKIIPVLKQALNKHENSDNYTCKIIQTLITHFFEQNSTLKSILSAEQYAQLLATHTELLFDYSNIAQTKQVTDATKLKKVELNLAQFAVNYISLRRDALNEWFEAFTTNSKPKYTPHLNAIFTTIANYKPAIYTGIVLKNIQSMTNQTGTGKMCHLQKIQTFLAQTCKDQDVLRTQLIEHLSNHILGHAVPTAGEKRKQTETTADSIEQPTHDDAELPPLKLSYCSKKRAGKSCLFQHKQSPQATALRRVSFALTSD